MFSTIAYAQEAGGVTGMAGSMGMLAPLLLMFVVLYFLMIRPQRKRQKELDLVISNLKSGDHIITHAGFYGTIDAVIDANTFSINIGNGVKVRIIRSGIAGKIDPETGTFVKQEKK